MRLYILAEQLIRMDPLHNSVQFRSFRFRADTLIREHPDNEEEDDRRRWYLLREALKAKLGPRNDFVTVEFNFDGELPPNLDVAVDGDILKALHEILYLDNNSELLKIKVTAKGKYHLQNPDYNDNDSSSDDSDDDDDKWYPVTIVAKDMKLPKAGSRHALHTKYQEKNVSLQENLPGDLWRKNNKGTWKLSVEVFVENFVFHPDTVSYGSTINKNLLNERKFCDVTIVTADHTEIPCHKLFLCTNSSVFTTMLDGTRFREGRENKINVEDMSTEGINALLKYLYYGDIREALVNSAIALELYQAADKYDISSLRKIMTVLLTEKQIGWYDTEVALRLFPISDENEKLREKCIQVLASKYNKLAELQSFREIFQTQTSKDMIMLTLRMYRERGLLETL